VVLSKEQTATMGDHKEEMVEMVHLNDNKGHGHDDHKIEPEETGNAEEKVEEICKKYNTSTKGLSASEAASRLQQYGTNELQEKKQNPVLRFLSFLWNPLSWAMEVAAIIAGVLLDFVDLGLIGALLIANACLGYYEEHSAGNALAALKAQLAPTAQCVRDGQLSAIAAKTLVSTKFLQHPSEHSQLTFLLPYIGTG